MDRQTSLILKVINKATNPEIKVGFISRNDITKGYKNEIIQDLKIKARRITYDLDTVDNIVGNSLKDLIHLGFIEETHINPSRFKITSQGIEHYKKNSL